MTQSDEGSAVDRAIGARIDWYMHHPGGRRRTQTELAQCLHLDQSAVSKKLRGERPFTVRELYAVAAWLGRSIHDIAVDSDQLGEPPVVVPRVRRSSNNRVSSQSSRGCVSSTRRPASNVAISCEPIAA